MIPVHDFLLDLFTQPMGFIRKTFFQGRKPHFSAQKFWRLPSVGIQNKGIFALF